MSTVSFLNVMKHTCMHTHLTEISIHFVDVGVTSMVKQGNIALEMTEGSAVS